MAIENLITDHLDLWTAAVRPKSSAGRGTSSKLELTGIKKLRELILELAVRGKLVPQDPSDEPASVLLERIAAEKTRLVADGKIKKPKALSEISEEEKPFELPAGWEWAKLGVCSADIHYGYTASANHDLSDYKLLRITDIQNNTVDWEKVPGCEISSEQAQGYLLSDGDILIARTGGTIGKSYLVENIDVHSVFASYLIRVRRLDSIYAPYVKTFLGANIYWRQLEMVSMGTGQPNVNGNSLKNLNIPLPPLAEQHRIVAKVDELMALCDQLELCSESQLAAHQTLVETLLATLTDSSDADELAQNWARLSTHFDTLFTTEASIDALKQTILQLAVMGKLVPQDPSDEPASTLMERIALEKLRLAEDAVIKRPKASPKISEEEKKFKLPVGWTWGRLDEIFNVIVDCPHSTPKFIDNGYVSLDTSCFKQGILIKGKFRYVSEETYKARNNRLTPCTGDIVFAREGSVGESVVIPDGLRCCLGQRVMLFRPSAELNPHFLRLTISSQMALSVLLSLHKGIGAKHVNVSDMKSYVIALPPAIEQDRIVAKVDELMTLCNQLKSRLQTNQQTQLALAESLVEGALA
ncbi:restriction endonuclease subunit S [Aeromonas veronii]|uniref:restriction endonuclease subunit S n=1 Tax=Aeromonas veronii TaxID=654 RepID=UPI001F2C5D93|nr:restriction endonuclease subunit S [Aeromonas veronii]MCF5878020.1 restriction endonuclease subunit S [Aeromonas veronii]